MKSALILFGLALSLAHAAESLTVIHDPEQATQDSLRKVRATKSDTLKLDSADQLTADRNSPDTVEYSSVDMQYDFPNQTFNLNEKALIKYRGANLSGDTIWFDQANQVLQASGEPILKDPKNPPLSGYRMKYNMKSRIGQIFWGSSFRDNQRFNGEDIRRLPDGRLQLARGDFSTCNDTVDEHYFFYCRRMVVKPKEDIVASPVVLNIADVPVAVLPIMVAPLKSGRRSGILTPKFGGDQSQGFFLSNLGVFWAINDYMDATLKSDIMEGQQAQFEKSSADAKFEYKELYVVDGNVEGKAYLQNLNLANSGWDIHFQHNQNLRPDNKSTLSGSGSFVSSQTLRQTNGLDQATVLDQQANANMTWNRIFTGGRTLTLRVDQSDNLVTGSISRNLPDAVFRSSGPLFPFIESDVSSTPGFFEKFNYSFNEHFNKYFAQARDSLDHTDTNRTWVGNSATADFDWSGQLLSVLNIKPALHVRNDWSGERYINPHDSLNKAIVWDGYPQDGQSGEFFNSYSASVNMDTKLYGIWRPEWGRFVGVRHTITPGVSYTYAPKLDTNFEFVPQPQLSQAPYQGKSKTVGFSLNNDFDLKYLSFKDSGTSDGSANLRVLNTRTSASYNFAKDSLQWSNIASSFGLQVIPDYVFTVSTQHSFYHPFSDQPNLAQAPELESWSYELSRSFHWTGKFNAGIMRAEKEEPDTRPWDAGFDYRYTFSSSRVGKALFQDQITHSSNISLSIQPTRKWKMTYTTQYDYNAGRFAMHQFNFQRDLHCWSMTFRWTPIGPAAGWNFSIFVTELPDIKLQSSDTKTSTTSTTTSTLK